MDNLFFNDFPNMYEELRAKYNPEGSPTRIFQLKLLDTLCRFDKFCRKNDIAYSLAGGNLIGAIRHKGFIPWDDDADVIMDRHSFEKLVSCASEDGSLESNLYLKWFTRPVIWFDNINFIDVFIFDNCPNNIILRKVKQFTLQFVNCLIKAKCRLLENSIGKFKPWFAFIPLAWPLNLKKLHIICQYLSKNMFYCEKNKYIVVYDDVVKAIYQVYPAHIIKDIIYTDFENVKLPIWRDYDSFLKVHFGDYMSIPKNIKIAGRVEKMIIND